MSNKPKTLNCSICGVEFTMNDSTWREKINRYKKYNVMPKFYCQSCLKVGKKQDREWLESQLTEEEKLKRKQAASERAKKQWASYDENKRKEIHEIFSKAQRDRIDAMSPEELKSFKNSMSERSKQLALNRTPEQREDFSRKCSAHSKKMWAEMNEDKLKSVRKKQSESHRRYIESLSEEERNIRNYRISKIFKALSPEAKEEWRRKLSAGKKEYYNKLPEEEQKKIVDRLHDGFKKYFSDDNKIEEFSEMLKERHRNRTAEEKASYLAKMEAWRNSLTPEQKRELDRRRFSSAGKNEKSELELKFERNFRRFELDKEFSFQKECKLVIGDKRHRWDYGIFNKTGDLLMVVDIDSMYYHSDDHDYDGVHASIRFDGKRNLTVSGNIMIDIIYEPKFIECFKRMMELLKLNFEGYVDRLVQEYTMMPFPEPSYNESYLVKSCIELYNIDCDDEDHQDMTLNTRNGDMLCFTFHKSIWNVKVGELSPADAWKDPKILRELVIDHILYHSYLNKNKILQGFDISEKYPRKRFISGGQAKMVINKYLMGFHTIFNPNSGFSGIILGAIAMSKDYVGQTGNYIITREAN